MRTDCTRDNRQTLLPNASLIGYGRLYAKRGDWIQFNQGDGMEGRHGRVIGRVHADGQTWLEIVALLGALDCPAIRWIKPEAVQICYRNPPRGIFDFICGDWSSPDAIIAAVTHGFRHADSTMEGVAQ